MSKSCLAMAFASLAIANSASANTLSLKCNLMSSRVSGAPYTLALLINQDAKTIVWEADHHNQVLDASVSAEAVTFRGPYTNTPSILNRTTGSLVVTDPNYRKIEFLCQHRA